MRRPHATWPLAAFACALALASAGCTGTTTRAIPSATPSVTAPATPSHPATPTPAEQGVSLDRLSIALAPMWSGFTQPVDLVNAGDGSGRLFVVQQTGVVAQVSGGRLLPDPYLDLSGLVTDSGEQGLLGMAFSPTFAKTGRLYVNYIDRAGDTVIARYTAIDPSAASPGWRKPQVVLHISQPYPNHNGGNIVFGPDGMLYVGMGDGGSERDPQHRGQDLSTLLGKMLRVDTGDATSQTVAPPATYRVPTDNPFASRKGARPEIWSYGLRNPWRYSFDASTGALWVGDVGQDAWEEIDRAPAGVGGQNWGWSLWEGDHRFPPGAPSISRAGFSFPVVEYSHPFGEAVTGGYVYRGAQYPALLGTYVYADYIKGWVAGIRLSSPGGAQLAKPENRVLLRTGGHPASFGVDERGELYLVDYGGAVYRVTASAK